MFTQEIKYIKVELINEATEPKEMAQKKRAGTFEFAETVSSYQVTAVERIHLIISAPAPYYPIFRFFYEKKRR